MSLWRHGSGDLGQMRVQAFGVGAGHHQACTRAALRADGAEQVGRCVADVLHGARTRAPTRPDIGQRTLLADPGFVTMGMTRPHREVALAACAQQVAGRALGQDNAKAALHHVLEIDATPAHHPVTVRSRRVIERVIVSRPQYTGIYRITEHHTRLLKTRQIQHPLV